MTMQRPPAPALDCTTCHRRIGRTRAHYLLAGDRVACTRCVETPGLHGQVYPDCPLPWHDLLDHLDSTGTRAGIAARLGLWPTRKDTTP
jgi:hypothetical protein